MEPITHLLTGACIGRAGLNRKTRYATLAAVLVAEAADLDGFWGFAGPVEELKHHRGITHTFIAVPVLAAVAVGVVWLLDRWARAGFPPFHQKERERLGREDLDQSILPEAAALKGHGFSRAEEAPTADAALAAEGTPPGEKTFPQGLKPGVGSTRFSARLKSCPDTSCLGEGLLQQSLKPRSFKAGIHETQQIRWGWLYLTAILAALSHLMLDWTNNYGLRPFYPFNAHWYSGSIVFIAEPVLWALLGAAMVMPWLFGLIGGEIGAKKKEFRGRGWAVFALTGMVLLWGVRWAEQGHARALAENTQIATAPVKRMALEPYPVNPFRWHAILETDAFYQSAEINTRTGEIASDPLQNLIFKPPVTAATEAAKQTLLGQVFLDWGTWAVVRDVGPVAVPGLAPPQLAPNRVWTTVEFTDLRFAYPFLGSALDAGGRSNRSPLGGWVYIVDGRDDAGEVMNGREQR
jgi:inner membrane protein